MVDRDFQLLKREGQSKLRSLNLIVLCGGESVEREVSLQSGQMVAAALQRRGHNVSTRDISSHDLSALETPADVFVLCLHGAFGEDGKIQSILDARGHRYTGSGAATSAIAIDKVATKAVWRNVDLPVPDEVVIEADDTERMRRDKLRSIGYPIVVKPIDSGSSVNISIFNQQPMGDQPTPVDAVAECTEEYGRCMVERLVEGRELTVGILGETAMPVLEIRTNRIFYDFHAKYIDDNTEYIFSLPLADKLLVEVQRLAQLAHTSIGARDFSRVDLILEHDSHPKLLEINTIPGFTSHSLLPKAAAQAGIGFDALCQTMVEMALHR